MHRIYIREIKIFACHRIHFSCCKQKKKTKQNSVNGFTGQTINSDIQTIQIDNKLTTVKETYAITLIPTRYDKKKFVTNWYVSMSTGRHTVTLQIHNACAWHNDEWLKIPTIAYIIIDDKIMWMTLVETAFVVFCEPLEYNNKIKALYLINVIM